MTLKINILGQNYDNVEPCFILEAGGNAFNRARNTWTTQQSLREFAKRNDKDFAVGEIGYASKRWLHSRPDMLGYDWMRSPVVEPVAVAPVVEPISIPGMPKIEGPFDHDGLEFSVNMDTCEILIDDEWIKPEDVGPAALSDTTKLAINDKIVSLGCDKLPCITAKGTLNKKYVTKEEDK